MISYIKNYLARQARKPTGWVGRHIAPRVFNRENKPMEQYGLSLMEPRKEDRILEIGFGNGRLISEIMPRIPQGKVCGIDISDEMISLASQRNRRWIENGQLEIKKASIASIPYPDKHFDYVFTANTIYFWPNPERDIREVKRVLKTGGQFICAMRLQDRMESMSSVVRDNSDIFRNLYREEETKQLFEDGGFREINIRSRHKNGESLFTIASGIR